MDPATPNPASPRTRLGPWVHLFGALLLVNLVALALRQSVGPWVAANVLAHPLLGAAFVLALWHSAKRRKAPALERLSWVVLVLSAAVGTALPFLPPGLGRGAGLGHGLLALLGCLGLAASWAGRVRRERSAALAAAAVAALLVPAVWWFGHNRPTQASTPDSTFTAQPASMAEEALGGKDGPFFPSAARTADGAAMPARAFEEAQTCGRSGCHPREVAEWESSPHRLSGFDNPWYRASLGEMHRERGAVAARWCAGCHTPGLLLTGGADAPLDQQAANPLATTGVSCLACHGAVEAPGNLGQGSLRLSSSWLHELGQSPDAGDRTVHDLLLRLAPELHREAYRPATLSPERSTLLCASCHKGHFDEPVNGDRYLSTFNDYDPWQTGTYSGESLERVLFFPERKTCVDCHMGGAEAGLSHRFAAANSALPALRGDEAQLEAVRKALADSAVTLDLFGLTAGRPTGEPVPQDAYEPGFGPLDRIPATVQRGHEARLDLVIKDPGVGHLFPGGKTDLVEAWVELEAVDEHGKTIFSSGAVLDDGTVDPSAHFLRSVWVDEHGERIRNHRMWDARAIVYNRRIEAHTAGLVRYRLSIPADSGDRLSVRARLLYRTFPPDFTAWAFERTGTPSVEMPILEVARAEAQLAVIATDAPLPELAEPEGQARASVPRWNEYGIALALQGDLRAAREAFQRITRIDPTFVDAWINLGRLAVVAGDVDEARSSLEKALSLDPGNLRATLFLGSTERAAAHLPEALAILRPMAERYPRDLSLRTQIANMLFQQGDLAGAGAELERVIAINPQTTAAHLQLSKIYRALGETAKADRAQALFERFKDDETAREALRPFLERNPDDNLERQRLHEHRSRTLETP